jgi:dTDP-4-dehydrorhamnose 3,5-epimerase
MHYQVAPHTETKLVTCLHGEVWDVVVDLRPESPSFLQWHSERLSALNHRSLLIPAGFAHGFQTLTNDVTLIYCHSDSYQPQSERGLHPKDPRIAIEWPLDISQISERDSSQPWLTPDFNGVTL